MGVNAENGIRSEINCHPHKKENGITRFCSGYAVIIMNSRLSKRTAAPRAGCM